MGTTVELTLTPDMGYKLADVEPIKVTDANNNNIPVTNNQFTMPASDVTVTAQFEALKYELKAYLNGAQYGSYTVSVNGESKTVPSNESATGPVTFTSVKTGDEITVTFSPAQNGQVDKFYLEASDHSTLEQHHESEIVENVCTVTMPGYNTNLSVKFVEASTTENVSYIDENGVEQTVEATILTGNEDRRYTGDSSGYHYETTLDGGADEGPAWYVVKKNVTYVDTEYGRPYNIVLDGDVRIIVADGAVLTVTNEIADDSLSVYGQTEGTGEIVAESVKSNTNICSAELSTGYVHGNNINVRGGELTVNGSVDCGKLSITSGVTNITGEVTVEEQLILGCADRNDSITVHLYNTQYFDLEDGAKAEIAGNQTLIDDKNNQYTGQLNLEQIRIMPDKTLTRLFNEPHTHNFISYSAEGATITATCNADNCPLEHHKAKLTINAPIELTYDRNEKAAQVTGDTDALGTPSITYEGSGSTVYGASETAPVNAGAYTASITLGEGDGAKTANVEYTIKPKPVTITNLNIERKVYDGTVKATATGGDIDGKVTGDEVNIEPGTVVFDDANAGEDKTVTFSGYSLSGDDAGNYALSEQPSSMTADINKRDITIKAADQSVDCDDSIAEGVDQVYVSSETKLVDGHSIADITLAPSSTTLPTTDGTITPVEATITDGSENDVTDNYDIDYEDGKQIVFADKEDPPSAEFTATGEEAGTLSELEPGAEYEITGAVPSTLTMTFTASGDSQDLKYVWAGTITLVKKGNGSTISDSDAQEITVTQAETPTGLDKTDCSTASSDDGTITGVTTAMEYRKSDGDWTDCPSDTVSGLGPGTYYVRVKAAGATLASRQQGISIDILEQVATPTFSPAEGTYTEAQSVTISCATDGADIYYTTDGTDPTTGSTKHDAPIPITQTTTLKAIAVKGGMTQSEVATAEYTISAPAPTKYAVTVVNGTGSGDFAEGETVAIKADDPAEGKRFKEWTTEDGVSSQSATSPETTFVMSARAVKVTATYEDATSEPAAPVAKKSIKGATVSGIAEKTWTGKALNQSPVVKLSGKTLKSGTDYTVAYKNNKDVGNATLIIKGKGSYTGTITKTFKINPKGTKIKKLKKAKKAVKVKWKKQSKKMSKSRITGYQIQFATNKKFTKIKKTVTVKGYKKVKKKVKKLKAKKKYYVRVRTYKTVGGVKYYSPWSKAKKVKTR